MNGDKNQINEIVNNLKKGPLDPNAEVSNTKVLKFNIYAITEIEIIFTIRNKLIITTKVL